MSRTLQTIYPPLSTWTGQVKFLKHCHQYDRCQSNWCYTLVRNGTISSVYIPTAYRLTHTVDGIHGNDPHRSIFIHRCLNTPLRSSTPPITCPPRLVPKVASTSTTRFLENNEPTAQVGPAEGLSAAQLWMLMREGFAVLPPATAPPPPTTTTHSFNLVHVGPDRAGMLPGGIWVYHTLSGRQSPMARNMIAGRGRRQKWSLCLEYLGQRCRLNDSSKSASSSWAKLLTEGDLA